MKTLKLLGVFFSIAVVFIICAPNALADTHMSYYVGTTPALVSEWWVDEEDPADPLGNMHYWFRKEQLYNEVYYGGYHGRVTKLEKKVADEGNGLAPTKSYTKLYYDDAIPAATYWAQWGTNFTLYSGVYLYGELDVVKGKTITINGDVTISVTHDSILPATDYWDIYVPSGSRLTIIGYDHLRGARIHRDDADAYIRLSKNEGLPLHPYKERGYDPEATLTVTKTYYLPYEPLYHFAHRSDVSDPYDPTYNFDKIGNIESYSLAGDAVDAEGYYYYHYLNENYMNTGKGRVDQKKSRDYDANGANYYKYQFFNPLLDTIIISSDTTLPNFSAYPPTPVSLEYNLSMLEIEPGVTLTIQDNMTIQYVAGGLNNQGTIRVVNGAQVNTSDIALRQHDVTVTGGSVLTVGSIVCNTLTIGSGSTITISPITGGPLGGTGTTGTGSGDVIVDEGSILTATAGYLSPYAHYEWAYADSTLLFMNEYDILGRKISQALYSTGAPLAAQAGITDLSSANTAIAQDQEPQPIRIETYYAATGKTKTISMTVADDAGCQAYSYQYNAINGKTYEYGYQESNFTALFFGKEYDAAGNLICEAYSDGTVKSYTYMNGLALEPTISHENITTSFTLTTARFIINRHEPVLQNSQTSGSEYFSNQGIKVNNANDVKSP